MTSRTRPVRPLMLVIAILTPLLMKGATCPAQDNTLRGTVTRVVDGTIIEVNIGDRVETVRYIGIAVPGIRGKEPHLDAAREANRRLVEGRPVLLVLDVQRRDPDGRLWAYIYVNGQLVNAELVHRGYAETATTPPNVRYRGYFVALQNRARTAKRGLWGGDDAAAYTPREHDRGPTAREETPPPLRTLPAATPKDIDRDHAACLGDASRERTPAMVSVVYNSCMAARGWQN